MQRKILRVSLGGLLQIGSGCIELSERVIRHANQDREPLDLVLVGRIGLKKGLELFESFSILSRLEVREPKIEAQSRHMRIEKQGSLVPGDRFDVVLLLCFKQTDLRQRLGPSRLLLRQSLPRAFSF